MLKKISLSFLLIVVIPTLFAGFYYSKIASKQYQVEASFVVQGSNKQDSSIIFGTLAALGGAGGSSTATDSYVIHKFIESINFIDSIKKDFDIRQSFTNSKIDWYSRLPSSSNRKELLEFWQEKLNIKYDTDSGITTIQVNAFQPENALKILELVIRESEKLVNQLSERSKNDHLNFSKDALYKAENELAITRKKLRTLRNQKKIVSPEITIKSKISIITKLETNLALKEAEFKGIKDYLQPSSFKIKSIKSEISSLKIQIKKLRKGMTNENNSNALSNVVGEYEKILIRQEFAEKRYQAALIDLASARVDASEKQRYLDVIVQPTLPDAEFFPDLAVEIPNVLLFSFLIWALGRLVIGLIKDHAGWV